MNLPNSRHYLVTLQGATKWVDGVAGVQAERTVLLGQVLMWAMEAEPAAFLLRCPQPFSKGEKLLTVSVSISQLEAGHFNAF